MTHNPEQKTPMELHSRIVENREVVMIYFDYNRSIIDMLKTFRSAWWNPDSHCWCISRDGFDLDRFILVIGPLAEIDHSRLKAGTSAPGALLSKPKPEQSPNTSRKRQKIKEVPLPPDYLEKLERLRYSPKTIAIYTCYIKDFIREFGFDRLETISVKEINAYLHRLISYNKISASQQHQRISSIKFYYERVLGREKEYYHAYRNNQSEAQGHHWHHLFFVIAKK